MKFNPADIERAAEKGLIPADAAPSASKPARASKYGNRKVEVDGHRFDSKREAKRYGELKLEQLAGAITDLRLQVPIRCVVNNVLVCTYVADFVYVRDGKEVVEDAKGVRTEAYKLKKRLVRACTGIEIREV